VEKAAFLIRELRGANPDSVQGFPGKVH